MGAGECTGRWLGAKDTLEQCIASVLADDTCDHTYMSYVGNGDRNCRCVTMGTDCTNASNRVGAADTYKICNRNRFIILKFTFALM